MVGYSEINPFACAVLAERCHATPPKYLADPHHDTIVDDGFALSVRLSQFESGNGMSPRLLRHLKPGVDPNKLTRHQIEELWWREYDVAADMTLEERDRRIEVIKGHQKHPVREGGTIPNFGDIWYITDEDLEALGPVDLLEGGSPCQAFSSAGAKQGLTDHRSALMLGYLDLIERMKRINGLKWVLWENVKGVLRDKGNGFGCLLAALAGEQGSQILPPREGWANAGHVSGPGGTVAWRVLDSQYFGVPQRRQRVFALAYVGDGPAPVDPGEILFERRLEGGRPASSCGARQTPLAVSGDCAEELVVFMAGQGAKAGSIAASGTTSPTLRSAPSGSNQVPTVAYALSMDSKVTWFRERTGTLLASAAHNPPVIATEGNCKYIVRKLMPVECERLQGFPDDWTDIQIGEEQARDSWRYEALGNSMTVDVMHWIGARLEAGLASALQDAA